MNPSDPRHDWMRQYAEGTASAEFTAQLEQALQEDAAFRRLFLEYVSVDLGLSNRAACLEPVPEAAVVPLRKRPWRAIRTWAAVAATAALLVGVSAWWLNRQPDRANDKAVAGVLGPYLAIVVVQSPEARWSGTNPQGLGHALRRDRCGLESGTATLQLDNGVELLLQAPAELQLHSVDHGELYRGLLSPRVPKTAVEFENTRNLGFGAQYATLAVPDGGRLFSHFDVNHSYAETDVLVSLCKMKEHATAAGITLSMKNLFGITPNSLYGSAGAGEDRVGYRGPIHGKAEGWVQLLPGEKPGFESEAVGVRVPRTIVDENLARPIHLAIVDGITTIRGGEGWWNAGVSPIAPGVILAGFGALSTDAVAAAVMGFDARAPHSPWPEISLMTIISK